ncbi:MAG: efflux RND transporter permease subunit [Termitinemataceae bacterium]|nr:MAG: efflux RND transporter permease subunit [Termitinemataceae bacterium]
MRNFIRLCAARPVTVIMMLFSMMLGGIFCAVKLPVDRLPEVSFPRITVETHYPGMGAEEVRSTITIPVEDVLSPLKGLEKISSVTRGASSIVILDFKWGINSAQAAVSVREAIDAIYTSLPQGADKPVVVQGSSNDEVHAIVAVRSLNGDSFFERNFCEYELRNRLRRIENAGNIILCGGDKKEIHVLTDVQKAAARKLTPASLANMISYETAELPAGNAKEGDLELVVLSSGKPKSINELSGLILESEMGHLNLTDIAQVEEFAAKKKSIFVYNGVSQTALEVYRRPGTDPVSLSRDLKKLIAETNEQFKNDVEITFVYDAVPEIISALINLIVSMITGAIAVTIVLIFFIRSFRYSLLAAFSIPVSLCFSLIALYACGKTLNSMSLSGLALGIGLVSDTSVIILDVLCRRFSGGDTQMQNDDIADCVSKLTASSFGGAATTAVVFIPIIFLPGPLGALFGDLSISLVAAVIAGWVYSQCALPVLFKLFFKKIDAAALKHLPIVSKHKSLEFYYRRFLRFAIRKEKMVLTCAAFASLAGLALMLMRPASFNSASGVAEINIAIQYPAGTKADYILHGTEKISSEIFKNDFIQNVFCKAGAEQEDIKRRSDPDYRQETVLYRCILKKSANSDDALTKLKSITSMHVENADVQFSYPRDKTEVFLGLNSMTKLSVKNYEKNSFSENTINQQIEKIAKRSVQQIKASAAVYGIENDISVNINPLEKGHEIKIIPYRDIQASLNITNASIASTVAAISEGYVTNTLEIDGKMQDVRVLGSDMMLNASKLTTIPVSLQGDSPVFLGTVSGIKRSETYQALARLDRSDVLYIDFTAPHKYKKLLKKIIDNTLQEVKGISHIDGSSFKRYQKSLIVTVILVLILLYMTMGAQFESFLLPVIFMTSIPFALAGSGPAMLLSETALDFGSILGIIVLLGIVVNNGIVLYETSITKLEQGKTALCAVYSGASERLNPVLATTITTLIVLAPLLASPAGSSNKSMAAAMLGGCIASTVLTLFVMPAVFLNFLKGKAAKK